jgi:hypothetical protein
LETLYVVSVKVAETMADISETLTETTYNVSKAGNNSLQTLSNGLDGVMDYVAPYDIISFDQCRIKWNSLGDDFPQTNLTYNVPKSPTLIHDAVSTLLNHLEATIPLPITQLYVQNNLMSNHTSTLESLLTKFNFWKFSCLFFTFEPSEINFEEQMLEHAQVTNKIFQQSGKILIIFHPPSHKKEFRRWKKATILVDPKVKLQNFK